MFPSLILNFEHLQFNSTAFEEYIYELLRRFGVIRPKDCNTKATTEAYFRSISLTSTMFAISLLTLLFSTIVCFIVQSHARPDPQSNGNPGNVAGSYSLNKTNAADTEPNGFQFSTTYNTSNISITGDGGDNLDLTDFTFNPLQMPTEEGLNATTSTEIFLPLHRASSSTSPKTSVDSTLASRSISNSVFLYATTGSLNTSDGHNVYSVAVNKASMQPFFLDAQAYGVNQFIAGNMQGNESNHDYFRYTSRGLTLVAISYGVAGSGDEPFNWGDFSIIASYLHNLTIQYPDNNLTWNGYVSMADHTRSIDFFVTPSFGDLISTNGTTTSSAVADTSTPAPVVVGSGSGGRHRLTKRVPTINLGRNGIRMTIRTAAAKVMAGLLWDLATNAYTTITADSGLSPTYNQVASAVSDPHIAQAMAQKIFHFVVEGNNPIDRETLLTSIQVLIEIASQKRIYAGFTEVLFGELTIRGRIIARWSLGAPVVGYAYCTFLNPDGSTALGCLERVYNP